MSMVGMGEGITRRTALRTAAAAAVVGAGSVALSACRTTGGTAQATAQHYKIILTMTPNATLPFNKTTEELYQAALAPFYKAHPGVGVKLTGGGFGQSTLVLAGAAADVISDNYPPPYMSPSGNLLLKLDGRLQQANINRSDWSAGQILSYVQSAPDHGLYMLPAYFSPLVYVVRLSDFDTAGLARPDPNWDSTEFAKVAQQMTKQFSNGQKRFGAVMEWNSNIITEGTWPFFAWGDGMLTSEGYSNLASASGITAGQWLYEELFWPGWATSRDQLGGPNSLALDQTVIQLTWDGQVLSNAQLYTDFQWDFYLPPTFPKGPTCMGTDDFYAIPATTKYPDLAWDLLEFLTHDGSATGWQRQLMKIGLLQPCLNSLWDAWISTLRSVAPPLQDKSLDVFKTMALNGRAFPEQYFPYSDSSCRQLTTTAMAALWNQTTSVQAAFQSIDQQVNAFLKTVIAGAKLEEKTAAAIAAVTPGPGTNYPAPGEAGLGHPYTDAKSYVVSSQGTWTMLGTGEDLSVAEDDAVFACQSTDATEATWTCRLTGLANVSETNASGQPQLSNWVKVGLLARGDLSDNAAEVGLVATGSYGLQLFSRPVVAAGSLLDTHFLWTKDSSGVVQSFSSPASTPTPNFITRPIWLRLTRKGTTWSAYASVDGTNFQQMGQSVSALGLGGAWVGLVCCAHNGDFNDTGYIRAVFDDLSGFTPDHMVQLGVHGVAPDAGPVPANWATIKDTASTTSSSSSSS